MFEPLSLREEIAPPGLVVVRLGSSTLDDALLMRSVKEAHNRWGIWGFSVLEVPNGDYEHRHGFARSWLGVGSSWSPMVPN